MASVHVKCPFCPKKIVVRNRLSNLLRHVRSHPVGVPSECCFCKESSSNHENVRQFLTQHYLPNHYDMYFGESRGRSTAPARVPATNIEPTPLADNTNDTMTPVQRTEMEPMDVGTSNDISCASGDQSSEIRSITLRGPQSPSPTCFDDSSHDYDPPPDILANPEREVGNRHFGTERTPEPIGRSDGGHQEANGTESVPGDTNLSQPHVEDVPLVARAMEEVNQTFLQMKISGDLDAVRRPEPMTEMEWDEVEEDIDEDGLYQQNQLFDNSDNNNNNNNDDNEIEKSTPADVQHYGDHLRALTDQTNSVSTIAAQVPKLRDDPSLRELMDLILVFLSDKSTHRGYRRMMDTELFTRLRSEGLMTNMPMQFRTAKEKARRYFEPLVKVSYPPLHTESVPYVSVVDVVKFWNHHPLLSEIIYDVNNTHTLPFIQYAINLDEDSLKRSFSRRQGIRGVGPIWEGCDWILSLSKTKNSWLPMYNLCLREGVPVLFLHIIPFVDGFRTCKRRLNGMNIVTITAGEFEHAIRSKSTSHAISIVNLMTTSTKSAIGTDPVAELMTENFKTLIKGVTVWNSHLQQKVGVIGLYHLLLGDTPGKANFCMCSICSILGSMLTMHSSTSPGGYKEGSLATLMPCPICVTDRDSIVRLVTDDVHDIPWRGCHWIC